MTEGMQVLFFLFGKQYEKGVKLMYGQLDKNIRTYIGTSKSKIPNVIDTFEWNLN